MNGDTIAAIFLGAITLSGWVAYFAVVKDLRRERDARWRERADAKTQVDQYRIKYEDALATNIVLSTKLIKWKRELR